MSTSRVPLPLFRTILFAADFSESSREAFQVATSLASDNATRLIVLHVLELPYMAEQAVFYGEVGLPIPAAADAAEQSQALLAGLERIYTPDHPVEATYRIREGDAAEQVLRVAQDEQADLIVMGTHGRTGLSRWLAGSVAESVLHRATIPVVTVRQSRRPAPAQAHQAPAQLV